MEYNRIIQGDCYEILPTLPEKSMDMILTDPPYGVTALVWDSINLDAFWQGVNRVIKDNGAVVVFSTQPFTSELILSNKGWYRYEIIWEKPMITNFWYVKQQIAKCHENIEVFYQKQPTYNVLKRPSTFKHSGHKHQVTKRFDMFQGKEVKHVSNFDEDGTRYPRSVVKCSYDNSRYDSSNGKQQRHPTQKPLELIEFLVKTYTNEGDLVLDPFSGSGTTAIACKRLNRQFLAIEKQQDFYEYSLERLRGDVYQPDLNFTEN